MLAELTAVGLALCLGASQRPYASSKEAGAAAASAHSGAEQATKCMQDVVDKNRKNNADAARDAAEVAKLIREKRKALEELSQGFYCSQCGRTASEIERAERIQFSEHLKNVKGRSIPAPANRIQAKAKEYDQKIAAARMDLEDYQKTWRGYVAEHGACANQRTAAYQKEANALAWAHYLEAEEKQKVLAEAARKWAEVQAKTRQARAEAAALERKRRRAAAEKAEAIRNAKWAAEQKEQERRQAELIAQLDESVRRFTEGLNGTELAVSPIGGGAQGQPGAAAQAPPLRAAESAYVQRVVDANAGSILDPSTWHNPHENTVFPTPAEPAPEVKRSVFNSIQELVDRAPFRLVAMPEKSASEYYADVSDALPRLSLGGPGTPFGRFMANRRKESERAAKAIPEEEVDRLNATDRDTRRVSGSIVLPPFLAVFVVAYRTSQLSTSTMKLIDGASQ